MPRRQMVIEQRNGLLGQPTIPRHTNNDEDSEDEECSIYSSCRWGVRYAIINISQRHIAYALCIAVLRGVDCAVA